MKVAVRVVILVLGITVWAAMHSWLQIEDVRHRELMERQQLVSEIARLREAAVRLEPLTPGPGSDVRWWSDRLRKIAGEQALDVRNITASVVDERIGRLGMGRVTVLVTGSFYSTMRFLSWLECSRPRVRIEHLKIESEGTGRLSSQFELRMALNRGRVSG